jgi:hypothetical protein
VKTARLLSLLALTTLSLPSLAAPAAAPPAPAITVMPSPPPVPPVPDRKTPEIPALEHVSATVVVQVDDRDAAAAALIAEVEGMGGWFASLSRDAVSFRVPAAKAEDFVARARGLGLVVDRSVSRSELGPQLADALASLEARRTVLAKYFEVLGEAKPDSVVAVESEIDRIIREIESYEGRVRLLRHRGAFADVTVSFRFRDRRAPSSDGTSPFPWVNTVDLGWLLEDFRTDEPGPRLRGARAVAPEGFAVFDARGRFAAVHPTDVVYRVRSVKNEPEADLAFWEEAVRTRLVQAGYKVLDKGEIVLADGTSGARLELGAPDGDRDALWIVSLFRDDGRIVIAEAAGEARAVTAQKEAILTAMRGTQL